MSYALALDAQLRIERPKTLYISIPNPLKALRIGATLFTV